MTQLFLVCLTETSFSLMHALIGGTHFSLNLQAKNTFLACSEQEKELVPNRPGKP